MDTFSRGTHLDPWYVTGVLESLGTFTFSRSSSGHYTLYFGIKVQARDQALLDDIQSFFGGIGSLYWVGSAASSTTTDAGRVSTRYYRVCRGDELEVIVRHFDEYPLRGSKARSFQIWREMVEAKREFRRPDGERLRSLAAKLSDLTARGRVDR